MFLKSFKGVIVKSFSGPVLMAAKVWFLEQKKG
jgi:hypothetical protein